MKEDAAHQSKDDMSQFLIRFYCCKRDPLEYETPELAWEQTKKMTEHGHHVVLFNQLNSEVLFDSHLNDVSQIEKLLLAMRGKTNEQV